jgi:hypothetical protein
MNCKERDGLLKMWEILIEIGRVDRSKNDLKKLKVQKWD